VISRKQPATDAFGGTMSHIWNSSIVRF
jgi:hypothetical protein